MADTPNVTQNPNASSADLAQTGAPQTQGAGTKQASDSPLRPARADGSATDEAEIGDVFPPRSSPFASRKRPDNLGRIMPDEDPNSTTAHFALYAVMRYISEREPFLLREYQKDFDTAQAAADSKSQG